MPLIVYMSKCAKLLEIWGSCKTFECALCMDCSIYDKFVEKATKRAQQLNVGDPFDSDTDQGPQVQTPNLFLFPGF